jgi:hypothetical protein
MTPKEIYSIIGPPSDNDWAADYRIDDKSVIIIYKLRWDNYEDDYLPGATIVSRHEMPSYYTREQTIKFLSLIGALCTHQD